MFTRGEQIDARYVIDRCIGSGGMADVYCARDTLLDRDVALKVLHPALAADPKAVERFKREARAAASLSDRTIVTVYNWCAHADTYYIAMEYVSGPTLKGLIRQRRTLPEDEALAITDEILTALAVAHAHGLVHRDVKLQNVLIAPDGHAKVTDFGIARTAGTSNPTTANVVMGTAQYLAPEQVLQGAIDGRTDLYNVGIVLFEMLTGRPPFQGDSALSVALLQVHAAPPSPRARRADLSPATDAIVLRALAKDPAERYQSAAAFREAVEAALASIEQVPIGTMPLPIAAPPGEPATPITLAAPRPFQGSSPRLARWLLALPLLLVGMLLLGGKLSSGTGGGQ